MTACPRFSLLNSWRWVKVFEKSPSLPRLLAEKGNYVSFQSGKWWEGKPSSGGFTSAMSHNDPAAAGSFW